MSRLPHWSFPVQGPFVQAQEWDAGPQYRGQPFIIDLHSTKPLDSLRRSDPAQQSTGQQGLIRTDSFSRPFIAQQVLQIASDLVRHVTKRASAARFEHSGGIFGRLCASELCARTSHVKIRG